MIDELIDTGEVPETGERIDVVKDKEAVVGSEREVVEKKSHKRKHLVVWRDKGKQTRVAVSADVDEINEVALTSSSVSEKIGTNVNKIVKDKRRSAARAIISRAKVGMRMKLVPRKTACQNVVEYEALTDEESYEVPGTNEKKKRVGFTYIVAPRKVLDEFVTDDDVRRFGVYNLDKHFMKVGRNHSRAISHITGLNREAQQEKNRRHALARKAKLLTAELEILKKSSDEKLLSEKGRLESQVKAALYDMETFKVKYDNSAKTISAFGLKLKDAELRESSVTTWVQELEKVNIELVVQAKKDNQTFDSEHASLQAIYKG